MAHDSGYETLVEALLSQNFCADDKFGLFVTYVRENDPMKVHVGPDGSFAAFNGDDEIIAEGSGAQDLFSILVAKTNTTRPRSPARGRA
jgi:hypothetical protein